MRRVLGPSLLASAVIGLLACASARPEPEFAGARIDPGSVVAKVDAFVLVIDASLSMGQVTAEGRKLDVARSLGFALAATIPEEDYRAGVRSFGQGPCLPADRTWLLWGMERWATGAAQRAIDSVVCADGFSRLDLALAAAETDLQGSPGRVALIVISDGMHMGERVERAAEALARRFGPRLCLWPIHVGDDRSGRALLANLAHTAACGRATAAGDLATSGAMEAFVREALLEPDTDRDGVGDPRDRCPGTPFGVRVDDRGCPLDADGDGVFDDRDRCPGTPPGTVVDESGCTPDADGDGVADPLDRCPDTPRGTAVDEHGCPYAAAAAGELRLEGTILFDFDKAEIRPDAVALLDSVAAQLKADPALRAVLVGHTDAIGGEAYNRMLSERRAAAVSEALLARGASAEQLSTLGRGESEPVVPNDSPENRARNRRVEVSPPR
ncbi:MAG: OmpA family protein [Acidobacteriota bacterium]